MSDNNASHGTAWIRFSVASEMRVPIWTGREFFEESLPCTVWGRYNEDYGVLWLEAVDCDNVMHSQNMLTQDQKEFYNDVLLYELCTKYF